jgi:hypothetical protein
MAASGSIVVLDRAGYSTYRTPDGCGFSPDGYTVRLVTDLTAVHDSYGREVESVVGIRADDQRALAEAVRWQSRGGGRAASGLVTLNERLLLTAARLREELAIAGPTMAEVVPFRDKLVMKAVLSASGIRVPVHRPFSLDNARRLLAEHAKVVVKPVRGAGSQSVRILESHRDVGSVLEDCGELSGFEVEEFVEGPLFHVDSVVSVGRVVAATAGRYLEPTTSYMDGRPLRGVAVADGPQLAQLLDFNAKVVACFPDFSGVTHHEIFLTSSGPCHCEIAARAGGTGVVAGFWSRTGVNLHAVSAAAQLRLPIPEGITVADHLTGWVLLYRPVDVSGPVAKVLEQPWVLQARSGRHPRLDTVGPAAGAGQGSAGEGSLLVSVRGKDEREVTDRLSLVVNAAA